MKIFSPRSLLKMAGLISICSCHSKSMPAATATGATGRVYYVSAAGSDQNSGTVGAPLKLINTALARTMAGDTVILRGGVYPEKVLFKISGSADKPIVVKAYPLETPVVDGSSFSVTGREAVVTIRNVRNIVLEGLDICNYKTAAASVEVNGIIVDEGCSNIRLRNNRIYNIENNATPENGRSAHGILIIGNTGQVMTNIVVDSNEIHDCNTGYSENLTINGYVDGFTISHNKVYNAENIGIDAAGGYAANSVAAFNYARNGVIADNELYAIDGTTGPIPVYSVHHGAIAIYIDGARNIIVERNKIHDSDRGIGLVSETADFPTQGVVARNNFVYNCYAAGIYLGNYIGATGGSSRNCYVVNNTLFQNNRTLGYYDEVEGELRLTEDCFDNVIQNNLVYGRAGDVYFHKYTATGSGNIVSNNLYYSAGVSTWIWNGIEYANFSDWVTASGETASITGVDPLLVNTQTPDLHVLMNSPVKNAGIVIQGDTTNGTRDIDGNPRIVGGKISIGAQQL